MFAVAFGHMVSTGEHTIWIQLGRNMMEHLMVYWSWVCLDFLVKSNKSLAGEMAATTRSAVTTMMGGDELMADEDDSATGEQACRCLVAVLPNMDPRLGSKAQSPEQLLVDWGLEYVPKTVSFVTTSHVPLSLALLSLPSL